MKVLLASIDSKYIHSNLAVRSLKKYAEQKLRESGAFCDGACEHAGEPGVISIEIAEYTINQQPAKVMADIYKHDADVIMFSCYIWNRAFMEKLLSDLAAVRPDVDIWLGGPEVSFDSEEILVRFSNVRGIMTGEGEETFAKLLSAYAAADEATDYSVDNFNSVSGIIYRSSAEAIVCTLQREPLDMDQLPFVYQELSDFENRIIYYESSRGCPFRCSYCLSSIDKKLRFRSLDLVKKELKFFLDNNVRQVKFVDRTFNCDHDRTMEIWRFIRDNDNGITNFHFEMAADILKEDEIQLLRQMRPGQVQLEIGVQTTNPKTLEAIQRPMDFMKLSRNVERIKSVGNVHLHLDLIAGLPYEDISSFEKSFNDVFALRPEQLQLGFLKVLKGSPIADRCEEYGLKYTAAPPYEVLETKWISYDDLLKLKQIEEMVEVYYNSGQFVRTLELLIDRFDSAFKMFEALANWYEESGLGMINMSRNSRYENLLKFAVEIYMTDHDSQAYDDRIFREALIYDYYSRDNVRTRPSFLGPETVDKETEREFYSRQEKNLWKHTHLERLGGRLYLFDYETRDPLTNNAMIKEVE